MCSSNLKKKIVNKIIEQLIFRYFNIRNFDILEYGSFYIWSFQILHPTLIIILLVNNSRSSIIF